MEPSVDFRKANTEPSVHFRKANRETYQKQNVNLSKRVGKDRVFLGLAGLLLGISLGLRPREIPQSSPASPWKTPSLPPLLLRLTHYWNKNMPVSHFTIVTDLSTDCWQFLTISCSLNHTLSIWLEMELLSYLKYFHIQQHKPGSKGLLKLNRSLEHGSHDLRQAVLFQSSFSQKLPCFFMSLAILT